MLKLIAAFLVAMAALFTFSVFTVLAAYAGMRIERRRAAIAHKAWLVKMVSDAKREREKAQNTTRAQKIPERVRFLGDVSKAVQKKYPA